MRKRDPLPFLVPGSMWLEKGDKDMEILREEIKLPDHILPCFLIYFFVFILNAEQVIHRSI